MYAQRAIPTLGLIAMVAASVLALALGGCRTATPKAATITPRPSATATPTPHPTNTLVVTVELPAPSPTSTSSAPPTPTQTAHLSSPLPEEHAALEAITDEVEQLRELDSDAPLALTFMTPEELRDWLVEELAEDYSPEEARRDVRVYAALELLPPETDLYTLTLALYTEQIAGFYDNDQDQMTVVNDETGLDALDKIVFAHEYTHDLQDQFLGLDDLQAYRESADEDAARAVTALIEGDAQTVTLLYLFNHLGELDPSALEAIQTDQFDAAPAVLREELTFPYMAGMTFVQAIRRQGGWDAVNAAYDAPPQSTEQILHPEKYMAGEAPIIVSLPPLTDTLGTDWQLIQENTLGEFLLNLCLDVHLPDGAAKDASAGWGGDRFALYEQPATGGALLLFVTAWDSEAEATEFASAYATFAEVKYGEPATSEDALGTWWQDEKNTTLLSTNDCQVIVIIGPGADTIQRVWPTLEKALSIEL